MADSTKNYIATYSDMKTVADAIRSKTGGSSALTFPNGWKTAIENIETGSAELNYSELVSGSTVLTAGKTYSFKMENKRFNNTIAGNGNIFFGASQDTRNNMSVAVAGNLGNNKLFSTKSYIPNTAALWKDKPTITTDNAGNILFKLGTNTAGAVGAYWDNHLLTYGLKLKVTDFGFDIVLGEHDIAAGTNAFNTGFSFFLCDRLIHPQINLNSMYSDDDAVSTSSRHDTSLEPLTAGTFKTDEGTLLFFTFTPEIGSKNTWRLYSSLRHQGKTNIFIGLKSAQTFNSNETLSISFDELFRVKVNEELIFWKEMVDSGTFSDPYVQTIGQSGVTDYSGRAYFGWVINQLATTNYSAIISSFKYGDVSCPPVCFTQGWTITGTSVPTSGVTGIVMDSLVELGTIPYTNRTTDVLGNQWIDGTKIAIKTSSSTLYIALRPADVSKFWGQTMLFDGSTYLIKKGSQWYLYNNMLDGTKTRFAVTLSAEPSVTTWCAGDVVEGTARTYANVTTKVEAKIPGANTSLVLMDYKLTDYDLVENPRAVGEVRIETDTAMKTTITKTVEDGFACPNKVYYALVN